MLDKKGAARVNRLLTDIGLPKRIQGVGLESIIKTMAHDKKFIGGKNRLVLVQEIGRVKVVQGIDVRIIKKAIKAFQ